MSVRYDFQCQAGHEFTLWSDTARLCPTCGNEFLKRIFIEPPMINNVKTKVLDSLVRKELKNRGITNIQGGGHEGDREKITYASTPADLQAKKIEKDFPQMNDPQGLAAAQQQVVQKWQNIGVKGIIKSGVGGDPTNETTKAALLNARYHDKQMVNRVIRKDPENLQVKKG